MMGKGHTQPTHSLPGNIRYIFFLQPRYSPGSLWLLACGIPVALGISFCGIYLPKTVVLQVTGGAAFAEAVLPIVLVGMALLVLNLLRQIIDTLNFALLSDFKNAVSNLKVLKCLHTDYENIESARFRTLMQQADETMWGSNAGSPVERMSKESIGLITSVAGYILFGTVLSVADPALVIILTVMPVLQFFVIRAIQNYQYIVKDETAGLDKKLWYIAGSAEDFGAAKDIRIYGMNDWLLGMFRGFAKSRLEWDYKLSGKYVYAGVFLPVPD